MRGFSILEASVKAEEGYIFVEDGVRLFFRKVGSTGSTVVIPNGLYFFDEFKQFADSHILLFYDVRNRGFSDSVTDASKLSRGIHRDVDDLEVLRKHFNLDRMNLLAHSYIGLMIGLYAVRHPARVNRLLQIGPSQPDTSTQYPPDLMNADSVLQEAFAQIGELQKQGRSDDPEEACKQFWSILRFIYVANPADAQKIQWGRCELANERNSLKYFNQFLLPSLQNVHLSVQDLKDIKAPSLIIHGKKDRSAPYGGGRDWASMLPNARLLTIENAAHVPWIEAPDIVMPAIRTFLDGHWPDAAQKP